MVMKGKVVIFALFLFVFCDGSVSGDTLQTECANLIQKMTNCLQFVSEKNDIPTKECCTSVTEVKDSNPACLCYFIQQIHNGDATLKGLGIKEARLLQLPSVCKLVNASIAECPRLLKLPANSPDVAIFKQNSSATTVTPISSGGTTPGATPTTGAGCVTNTPQLSVAAALVVVSIFFFAFSSGVVNIFD